MQSTVFFMFAIVVFATAKQLNPGPQTFETSPSTKTNDKRYASQGYTLFLTASEIEALNEANNSANKQAEAQSLKENQQFIIQRYSQPELNEWQKYVKLSSDEQSKEINQESLSKNLFVFKNKPSFENQDGSFDRFNFNQEQKYSEQLGQNINQNDKKNDFKWIQYNPISKTQQDSDKKETDWIQHKLFSENQQNGDTKVPEWIQNYSPSKPQPDAEKNNPEWFQNSLISKAQEESLLHEDLQQQWNRILEHNRGQLKTLSSAPTENQKTEDTWGNKDASAQWQPRPDEETRNELEKAIEFALKHQGFEFRQENSGAEQQAYIQRSPILIQKEVKVTNHLPVPVVKQVKVSIPTPVLVPVPEPFEVKVPHPYPVPYQVIKRIPVPVIRRH